MPESQEVRGSDYRHVGKLWYVASVPPKASATLTPKQVASELGVDEKTVRNWIQAGVLEATRTTAGHYHLKASVVPTLKKLSAEMPLNTRTLRRRQLQQEDRVPPAS
jgi:excisionase family DNA binding protein